MKFSQISQSILSAGDDMFGLHERFQKQLTRRFDPLDLLLKIIKKKLVDLDIQLSPSQLKIIRSQLKASEPVITLEITDQQVARAKIKSKLELENAIGSALTDISAEALELVKKLEDSLPDIMEEVAEYASENMFRSLRRSYRFGLKERRENQEIFEEDLDCVWGKAISQIEVLLGLSFEAAGHTEKIVSRGGSSYSEVKWVVLSRLHARVCQIAGEIIALLKAGYADGAQARWRSLHEVTVVAAFIYDQDDKVAEQYLLHDVIEEYKGVAQQLNLWPELEENEEFSSYLSELEFEKAELVREYGRFFSEDYGWAASALGSQRPSFRKIEEKVNLSCLRLDYREASHNVHAGVRGAFYRVGLHPDSGNILLAGASDFGLANPGNLTAMSLVQATATLLQGADVLDSIVAMKVILKQGDITRKEFLKTHRRVLKVITQQSSAPGADDQ